MKIRVYLVNQQSPTTSKTHLNFVIKGISTVLLGLLPKVTFPYEEVLHKAFVNMTVGGKTIFRLDFNFFVR